MDFDKLLQKAALDTAVNVLLDEQNRCGGKIPRQFYSRILTSLHAKNVGIDRATLHQRVHRARVAAAMPTPPTPNPSPPTAQVMFAPQNGTPASSASATSSLTSASASAAQSNADDGSSTIATNDNTSSSSNNNNTRKRGGRPKGTGVVQQKQKHDNVVKCKNEITNAYITELAINKTLNKPKIEILRQLIEEKKAEFNVTEDISPETIKSRVKRNMKDPSKHKLESNHPGIESPLKLAEQAVLEIVLQMCKIRQPLTKVEVMKLMNDAIKGTVHEETFKQVKMSRVVDVLEEDEGPGEGWWRNFRNRHKTVLSSSRGERFSVTRAEWTRYETIEDMYDGIYPQMVDAGVAVKLDTPIFTDRDGNEVDEDDPKKFGRKQEYKITRPELIFFADETGCNTSQKKDGHVGGTKFLCARGTKPQQLASTTDHSFTLLPFTSATGEAVCCAVIFQCKNDDEMKAIWASGVDYFVTDPVKEDDGTIPFEKNFGKDKFYPGGPTCEYNGKTIPCLHFSSPSGGITGEILAKILEQFDEFGIAPRDDGVVPFVLLDGHQSRLDPAFLTYINGEGHKWKICLGVPYATSLWQVGDASELNGNFKSEWSKAKQLLLGKKFDLGLDRKIEPVDIMPLLNATFHKGFNNKRANLKAVAVRGWGPLNRALLDHPDLVQASVALDEESSASATVVTTSATASSNLELNVVNGTMSTCLGRMLGHYKRTQHCTEHLKNKRKERDCVTTNLTTSKRFSSGALVANGVYNLDNPEMLAAFDTRTRAKTAEAASKLSRKKEILKKNSEGVAALRNEFGHEKDHRFQNFNMTQCAVYLQYKKRPGRKDGAMPASVEDRRKRCVEWIGRNSPSQSFDEGDDDEENNVADDDDDDANTTVNEDEVAAALFEMAHTVDIDPGNDVAAM